MASAEIALVCGLRFEWAAKIGYWQIHMLMKY